MKIPDHIFKGYDIRGRVPEELNADNIYRIAQAILRFYQERCNKRDVRIVAGHDMRTSAPALYPILKKALIDGGAQIADVSLVSTPTLYFAVLHLEADGGVELTASHNPPDYNGIKMVLREGGRITKIGKPTGILEIREYAREGVVLSAPGGREENITGIIEQEIAFAFAHVNPGHLKPLKVVADPANAMGITYLGPLFEKLPGELIKMNFELDGTFPAHQPDPLVFKNLEALRRRVIEEGADLGLAPDGDGDRMFFIDEKGQVVTGAQSTALVARELLKTHPGATILFDIRYTLTPKAIIRENGGKSIITQVGHAYITRDLNTHGGLYGGESSEHNFFQWTGGAESQLIMILLVMKILSESGKTLSELVSEIRRSFESGEHNFRTENAQRILSDLKEKYATGAVSELDGVAIDYPDWRFNVRTSNTEPLMRLNLEARSRELMERKLKEVQALLAGHGAIPHGD
jgi:phosphomannomutase